MSIAADNKERVDAYIDAHEDELVADVMRLIRIASVKGEPAPGAPFGAGPAEALACASQMLESYGFVTKSYDGYVVTGDLNDHETALDILAHLDVVPVGDDWTVTEPFDPKVVDGKIYGRGSNDDKGPAVAALLAMRAIRELGIELPRNVRLILGSDEESGSDDIAYYYDIEKPAPMTLSPDAEYPLVNIEKGILHGEFTAEVAKDSAAEAGPTWKIECGTGINVIPGSARAYVRGIERGELEALACAHAGMDKRVAFSVEDEDDGWRGITAVGTSCHAAHPQNAVNPVTALLALLAEPVFAAMPAYAQVSALAKLFPHGDWSGRALGVDMSDEESGALEISLTKLSYADGHFYGGFDCRAPLCATDENLRAVVAARLAQDGMTLGDRKLFAPHYVPEESAFVQTLLDCHAMYAGRREKPLCIGGGTYVHAIPNGVAFGCSDHGVVYNMHGGDEFMPISQLVISAKIYAQAIMRLCDGKDD